MTTYDPARCARIAWEACREHDRSARRTRRTGPGTEFPPRSWDELLSSGRDGVIARAVAAAAGAPASELHAGWRARMAADGWTHGPTLDTSARTDPDLVPYERLDPHVTASYELFRAIVLTLADRPDPDEQARLLRFPADATAVREGYGDSARLRYGQATLLPPGSAQGFVPKWNGDGEHVQADGLIIRVMFGRGQGQLFDPRQLGGIVADWLHDRGVNLDPAGLGAIALEATLYDTGHAGDGAPAAESEPRQEREPEARMAAPVPSVGRIVHYVSYGTPGGEYASECRAAVVTEVGGLIGTHATIPHDSDEKALGLCVLNPEGLFFNRGVIFHEGDIGHDHAGEQVPARSYRGGTWHWPERTGQ